MYVKVHSKQGRDVVAICDENLIGKTFETKDKQLKISKEFYKGEKKNEEEIINLIKVADNLNIVGKNSVEIALKTNIVLKSDVKRIKNIPYIYIISP